MQQCCASLCYLHITFCETTVNDMGKINWEQITTKTSERKTCADFVGFTQSQKGSGGYFELILPMPKWGRTADDD